VTIKKHIQNEFDAQLTKLSVLVVYDADDRYRDLCAELADENTTVIDVSTGSIPGRELAIESLLAIGKQNSKQRVLIYVPTAPPDNRQKKMTDPFWMYSEAGTYFPRTSRDEFDQICLAAKPRHATKIRKVFNVNPNPSFDLIDNIGGGVGWPTLQSVLSDVPGAQSVKELVVALLVPSPKVIEKLNSNQTWTSEAKDLLKVNFGLDLITQQESWKKISDELWRFVLFSEFVFDLPEDVDLPASLADVPCSIPEAKPLVFQICETLRGKFVSQAIYIERAQEIEKLLKLPERCDHIEDLGEQDTFPFEERSFFNSCVTSIENADLGTAKAILKRSKGSVWTGRGESQAQWRIIEAASQLVEKCQDAQSDVSNHVANQEKLIRFYLEQLYKVDQYHREFEHAIVDHIDLDGVLTRVIDYARKGYHSLTSQVQSVFVKHLVTSGWPPAGFLSNTQIFEKYVASRLQESGHKIAFFMIDAMRYELGVELARNLSEAGNISIEPAFAAIPTVTPIGMTSLLPEAQSKLSLKNSGGDMVVMMGETPIKNVQDRMKYIQSIYGSRFQQIKLDDVLIPGFRDNLKEDVELLVIRSNAVDAILETEYKAGLPAIKRDMQLIRAAIYQLKQTGFDDVVIATDHGFCINPDPDAGDTCQKPPGEWKNLHSRCVLGTGSGDNSNWVCTTEHLGLAGDFEQIGGPKSLASYTANAEYFHGGASLQEVIVPCLTLSLAKTDDESENITYSLLYKNGATIVTTRLPVFELEAKKGDLFAHTDECDVLLQAVSADGTVIGEPKAGGIVNPATGTITLRLGMSAKIPLEISRTFEGKFTLKLLDPTTHVQLAELKLETEYMV
jgi:hypothetical protein